MQRILAYILAFSIGLATSAAAQADARTDRRLEESRKVFETFSNLNEQAIPGWLLERAYGIVVVPNVIKAAIVFGGRGGKGVMAVRQPDGTWSNPVFVTMGGANFGFQWGLQSTDVVLVLMSRRSVEGIAGGKVTLGADASVAAGPVGRTAAATTDATFKAQVLSYSRSEGLFAGVALDGGVILIDDSANETAYGVAGILPSQILEGRVVNAPQAARDFTAALERATGGAGSPATQPAPAPAPAQAPTKPDDTSAGGVTTYPMEDPNPGAPPPE
jgi:lipid-binding SYLF domain-containing protein